MKFLGKEQNQKALEYLKKGYKAVEISKITGVHINTLTKIKILGLKSAFKGNIAVVEGGLDAVRVRKDGRPA